MGAILVVVFAVKMIVGLVTSADEIDRFDAAVGDCLAGNRTEEVRVVGCADPAATRKVVGREIRPAPATQPLLEEACAGYPAADDVFWRTLISDQVLILCLQRISP